MYKTTHFDLGSRDYLETWQIQERLFKELVDNKILNREKSSPPNDLVNQLLLVEHPHVFTMGKSGMQSNLLISPGTLQEIGAKFYQINRGGDITYHGPGQLVGYPIFDLESMGISVREYISRLEEAIISTLNLYGVRATRLDGATGVWLDANDPARARKICAIGVRVSRMVTMHGFALNVNTDLSYFKYINPCGFIDKGVTTLQKELGRELSMVEIKTHLLLVLKDIFSLDINPGSTNL